ncbi:hypothetical protein niasHT_032470 [Heterodera trifolii]|uniref:DNA-directed RNA polymerases I, II, and III subunit RPABC5 n=1 Tax=Heterodera trifolii TaxID=157864 RepID=A0ABD2J1P0_9BILA
MFACVIVDILNKHTGAEFIIRDIIYNSTGTTFLGALDQLGLRHYCCRRMLLSHVDLIEKLLIFWLFCATTTTNCLVGRLHSHRPATTDEVGSTRTIRHHFSRRVGSVGAAPLLLPSDAVVARGPDRKADQQRPASVSRKARDDFFTLAACGFILETDTRALGLLGAWLVGAAPLLLPSDAVVARGPD